MVHDPFAFARSIAARPAGAIRPSAINRSTRALLVAAHTLLGLRGAKYSLPRSSSNRPPVLSTHPKQRASSTAAS